MPSSLTPPGPLTTTPEPLLSSSSTTTLAPNHAFVKLCLLWTALHQTHSLPPACQGVLTEDSLKDLQGSQRANLGDILERINGVDGQHNYQEVFGVRQLAPSRGRDDYPSGIHRNNHMKFHYRYTTRSLSVIG